MNELKNKVQKLQTAVYHGNSLGTDLQRVADARAVAVVMVVDTSGCAQLSATVATLPAYYL